MDRMVGSYLARRGKKRYCDKSLGTARYAPLLARVYSQARFVCMYRHPMDVIASGAEACPWGLNGYGFEPYIAATPGNVVMALANFWADNVAVTLAAEERFPDQCFRLRYEDLVANPEAVMAELFAFLGVSPAPGISHVCFSGERERFGPADYKIWFTSGISSESVGRGWSVPSGMIAPELLGMINELAGKLGYLAVDGEWGTTGPPADLRVPVAIASGRGDPTPPATGGDDHVAGADAEVVGDGAGDMTGPGEAAQPVIAANGGPVHSAKLGDRLSAGLARAARDGGAEQWGAHGGETFVAVAVTRDPECVAEYWHVDLGRAVATRATKEAQENSDWDMIGTLGAWERVLAGEVNLSVALRSCDLRYCDNDETSPLAADKRIAIIARLLALVNW